MPMLSLLQDSEAARCADGSGPARVEGGRVRLRPRLTAVQYRAALGEVAKGYKVCISVHGGRPMCGC